MRVCAVSLPELRVELARELDPASNPLAVVVAPPPMTHAKLLGSTRLSVVSREARALGVRRGHTIAQARARAEDLVVRIVRPDAVRDVLARIAEVGLAFGATVSFGVEGETSGKAARASAAGSFGDVVWIDVTGCAHLHAPTRASPAADPRLPPTRRDSIFDGETILASRLTGAIASLGHACAVAIADGPRVAAMLAASAAESAARATARRGPGGGGVPLLEPIVVRPGENATAIARLPVSALPLAPEDVRWLATVGVRTIEQMRALPRAGLGARLGARARDVLALVDGDDRAPLAPYVPPEVPEEETTLEYGVEGAQALTFVAKALTDRLAARLQGRAVAASCVELELRLDGAMLDAAEPLRGEGEGDRPSRRDAGSVAVVTLDLPSPLSLAGDLLAALRPKIERLVLGAPVLAVKLRATALVHKTAAALSLFDPQPKAERALPRLVAELVSDLGPEAVSTLDLGDGWVPEERSRLVPFGQERARARGLRAPERAEQARARRHMLSSAPEPTRLLAEPRAIAREEVRITRHLARLESVAWWRELPHASGAPSRQGVDYVQGWSDEGEVYVEIDRATGKMRVRGWFD